MIRIILIGVILLGGVGFILYHLLKFGLSSPKSPDAIAKERLAILKRLEKFKNLLIPFSAYEASLISTRFKTEINHHFPGKSIQGLFYSIYEEPVFAFANTFYGGGNELAIICTTEYVFTYIRKNFYTKVYINEAEVGTITPEGILYSPNERLLAELGKENSLSSSSVFVYGKEIGEITNINYKGNTTQRVFMILEHPEQDEYELFLCLTLFKMMKETA